MAAPRLAGAALGLQPDDVVRQFGPAAIFQAAKAKLGNLGSGAYGDVVAIPGTGTVIKGIRRGTSEKVDLEALAQADAARLGIAPPTHVIDSTPSDNNAYKGYIQMQDVSDNYSFDPSYSPYGAAEARERQRRLEVSQQLSRLALQGMDLEDRHGGNIAFHNMTGRPIQVDFGFAYRLGTSAEKAAALANNVRDGLRAAGAEEIGQFLHGLVGEMLREGRGEEALDIAKQGMSRLMKIKRVAETPMPWEWNNSIFSRNQGPFVDNGPFLQPTRSGPGQDSSGFSLIINPNPNQKAWTPPPGPGPRNAIGSGPGGFTQFAGFDRPFTNWNTQANEQWLMALSRQLEPDRALPPLRINRSIVPGTQPRQDPVGWRQRANEFHQLMPF